MLQPQVIPGWDFFISVSLMLTKVFGQFRPISFVLFQSPHSSCFSPEKLIFLKFDVSSPKMHWKGRVGLSMRTGGFFLYMRGIKRFFLGHGMFVPDFKLRSEYLLCKYLHLNNNFFFL